METLAEYLERISSPERLNIRKTLAHVGQSFNQYVPGFAVCPKIYVTTAPPLLLRRFPQMDDAPPSPLAPETPIDRALRDQNDDEPLPEQPPEVDFDRDMSERYDITPLNETHPNQDGEIPIPRKPAERNSNNPLTRELDRLRALDREDMRRTISIENLLGKYVTRAQTIVLYERGINWSKRKSPQALARLLEVVLIHELAHWMTHQLGMIYTATWDTERFIESETFVKEGWAQLITWWLVKDDHALRTSFTTLNRRQRAAYHIYKRFVNIRPEFMLHSLEHSRVLKWPIYMEDWYGVVPRNMSQKATLEKSLFVDGVQSWLG